MPFTLQKSDSFGQLELQPNQLENSKLFTSVSNAVIEEFQKIVTNTAILGARYLNPYTKQDEAFPTNPLEFNSKHLQILARNEYRNTTGIYNFRLYGGLLNDDEICRIRHLQKLVVNHSEVKAEKFGGYPINNPKQTIQNGKNFFLIDQAGFQWQKDKRNSGCIFFYPDDNSDQNYQTFQKDMYRVTFQEERPEQPSQNKIGVNWKLKEEGEEGQEQIPGVIDLNLLKKGFKEEFKQAFLSANHAFSLDTSYYKHCLRFTKAELGFFANGIALEKTHANTKFSQARLEGIAEALEEISKSNLDKSKEFDTLELPFSEDRSIKNYEELLNKIKTNAKKIGINNVSLGIIDALKVNPNYKVALTNCADPHAMVGNEGDYGSVDAMIATNCSKSSQNVNVAYKQKFVELSYDSKSLSLSTTNTKPDLGRAKEPQQKEIRDKKYFWFSGFGKYSEENNGKLIRTAFDGIPSYLSKKEEEIYSNLKQINSNIAKDDNNAVIIVGSKKTIGTEFYSPKTIGVIYIKKTLIEEAKLREITGSAIEITSKAHPNIYSDYHIYKDIQPDQLVSALKHYNQFKEGIELAPAQSYNAHKFLEIDEQHDIVSETNKKILQAQQTSAEPHNPSPLENDIGPSTLPLPLPSTSPSTSPSKIPNITTTKNYKQTEKTISIKKKEGESNTPKQYKGTLFHPESYCIPQHSSSGNDCTKIVQIPDNSTEHDFFIGQNSDLLENNDLLKNNDGSSPIIPLAKTINEALKKNLDEAQNYSKLTKEEAAIVILIAIKNKGVSNNIEAFKSNLQLIDMNPDEAFLKKATLFSSSFQQKNNSQSILTGNPEPTSIVGMRLKRLTADYAYEMLKDKRKFDKLYQELQIDKSYTKKLEAEPTTTKTQTPLGSYH